MFNPFCGHFVLTGKAVAHIQSFTNSFYVRLVTMGKWDPWISLQLLQAKRGARPVKPAPQTLARALCCSEMNVGELSVKQHWNYLNSLQQEP